MPANLKAQGVKGIITDLDNTLVAWDVKDATPEVIEWFASMEKEGINITIISNNKLDRVKVFSDPLCVPYVYSARKPLTRAFKSEANETALKVGDVHVLGYS